MAIFSGNLENLRALYIDQLQHLLSMEMQLTEALPKMAEAATEPQLKHAFTTHLQETRQHVTRIKEILGDTRQSVSEKKSKAASSLISEGEEMIKDAKDNAVRDAALILAGQRVEHYEMASYGAVRQYAQLLGEDKAMQKLEDSLKDEGHADHLLTEISKTANTRANKAA